MTEELRETSLIRLRVSHPGSADRPNRDGTSGLQNEGWMKFRNEFIVEELRRKVPV